MLLLLAAAVAFVNQASAYNPHLASAPTDHGVWFGVGDVGVELAVFGEGAFRISIRSNDISSPPQSIPNPMTSTPASYATFKTSTEGTLINLATEFGSLSMDTTSSAFTMTDAKGKVITKTGSLFTVPQPKVGSFDTCSSSVYSGYDVNDGTRSEKYPDGIGGVSQEECCETCNNTTDCKVWVFAAGDSQGTNCWLLQSTSGIHNAEDRTVGGVFPGAPIQLKLGASSSARFYGDGAGSGNAQSLTRKSSSSKVTNTEFEAPTFWSSDGYRALVVSAQQQSVDCLYCYPASWEFNQEASLLQWDVAGPSLDLYLIPAKTMSEGVSALWDLTGRPAVPPRYAFGFHVSRWGWKDSDYIEGVLQTFRKQSFPIDSWISDFEWFAVHPDYSLPDQGEPDYEDFGYNNITFPDPTAQLKHYHDDLHIRFGGIRKPRLGNSELLVMAHSKNWTVTAPHGGGAPGGSRNLNYSIEAVRDWYMSEQNHYLTDGVDYFWNDEGESYYFAFYYWNLAQYVGLSKESAGKKRFWTINRSFTPGMQRMGAATWTGDVPVSWDSLRNQPGYILNWGLAGTHLVTCDTGGFNGDNDTPLLLTRWMQYATFMPIMRVHSTLDDEPHFPFLYGDEAADAMRKTLNLRYMLIPYHYSLAHSAFKSNGLPMMRPLSMLYTNDPKTEDMTLEWMDGDSMLVAPVLQQDNTTDVYLPVGTWYEFNTTTTHQGPTDISLENVALDHIPVYVKAGGIIPVGPVLQYSDQEHEQPLNVHIYPGSDGSFLFTEDDGETMGYSTDSDQSTRTILFTWSDASKTLTFTVSGAYEGANVFGNVKATAFFGDGAKEKAPIQIGKTGSTGQFQF